MKNIATDQKRLNSEITAKEIRVTDANGEQLGVISLARALELAEEAELDLVEIAPQAEPPVCRIMDYGKYVFEANKQKAIAKKKQKQIQVKEIKFRPGTEEGDYQVKLRNLTRFLEEGNKTKVSLRFRGREMAHQDLGLKLLERVADDLKELSVIEQHPKKEGRQMIMVLAPSNKK
ncbi:MULTISPECIES: translation initiation factor IF-3 [unclassified Methylophaga]|uniref:translation initiation factor IF-3 n=2 Tax=Methylophaga TaxID=40222 RepID=UPI000C971472|nr:translation initiation factor IF-3 [Methylophaga sp.]MAY16589.1 translation initiation factor IF-3 [Methylophaga sp.]MBN44909.1 translation initiation factor IF-3 [Methylophaga sp.]